MPRGDLARAQERRVLRHRQHQFAVESSKNFYNEAKFHDLISQTVERANRRAATNEAAAAQFDLRQKEAAEAAATAQQEAQARAEAERAEEERKYKEEEERIREEKRRQAIIDASPELRVLKAKISAAAGAQQQQVQLKEAFEAVVLEQEHDLVDRLEGAYRRAAEAREEEKETKERLNKALATRVALQTQLQERDALRVAAKEEVKRERAAIEAIVEQIHKEEAAQRTATAQRRYNLAVEAATMVALQKELRDRQKAAEAAEEIKIQEYMRLRREREDRVAQQRAQRRAAIDGDFERARIAAEAEAARLEEEEALLDMLRADMEVQRAHQAAVEAAARRASQRRELMEAQELAFELKAQRKEKDAAWKADFRQKMMERLAEEDRVAAMTAAARRVAIAAHLKEAERCICYKQKLTAAMREEEEKEAIRIMEKEAARKAIVEEERMRLLQEAAAVGAALGAAVPRGVLQRPEDLEKLNFKERK